LKEEGSKRVVTTVQYSESNPLLREPCDLDCGTSAVEIESIGRKCTRSRQDDIIRAKAEILSQRTISVPIVYD
jgi:hypothetical protein